MFDASAEGAKHMTLGGGGAAYVQWLLTDAQGSTFVDVEMGINPRGVGNRVFDAVAGRMYFRRWLEQSIDALRSVAGRASSSSPPAA